MESKLIRPKKDRVIAGVCSGISNYFKVDVIIVRLVFVLLAVYAGSGVLIYLILLIAIPEEDGVSYAKAVKDGIDKEEIKQNVKQGSEEIKQNIKKAVQDTEVKHQNSYIFAVLLIIIGLILLANNMFPALSISKIWPLLIVALGIILLLSSNKKE